MNILSRAIFLIIVFLHAISGFSLVYRSKVIHLKDKYSEKSEKKIVSLGDRHNIGSATTNQIQASFFFEFITKLASQDLDRPIVLLTESVVYAPEILTKESLDCLCVETELSDFHNMEDLFYQGIIGKTIGDQLFHFQERLNFPSWISFYKPSLLHLLDKLLKKSPNIQIKSLDPRGCIDDAWLKVIPQQHPPLDISLMDVVGYPSRMVELYKYPYRDIDIKDENQKNYFINDILPYTLERISYLSRTVSSNLNIKNNLVYAKKLSELTELENGHISHIIKNHNDATINDTKNLNREMLFDVELFYEIISQKHNHPKTIFVVLAGGAHINRLIQALENIDMVDYITPRDYENLLQNPSVEAALQVINDVAIEEFKINLQESESAIFSDIKNIFPDGSIFYENYINTQLPAIIEMIKNTDISSKDAYRYSLLGYLVDFQDTFLSEYSAKISSEQALALVQALLDNGADPNVVDPDGMTPLIRALYYLNMKLNELLQNEPSLQRQQEILRIIDTYQKILTELIDKGADTHFPLVGLLLSKLRATMSYFGLNEYPEILCKIEEINREARLGYSNRVNNTKKRPHEEEAQDLKEEINDNFPLIKRSKPN